MSEPRPQPSVGPKWAAFGLGPALLVLVIALWEIWAAARAGADVPGDEDWTAAAAAVRAAHQPGELIVFAPAWIDPVGRHHLGDLIPIEQAARMDAARYAVVWELSIRAAEAAEAAGRRAAHEQRFGGVRVRRLVREPPEIHTDFVAEFGRARVAGPSMGRARVYLEEVGFTPRRCVRVEPRPDQTVTITYPGVTLGDRVVGYVGLADVFTRRDVRDPGELVVSVDGVERARIRVGIDDGWRRFHFDTDPAAAAEVSFAATAVGAGARQRQICFAAEARTGPPQSRLAPTAAPGQEPPAGPQERPQ
ncbi:hypothetical protein [Haliangium sp.]|uniref:hypothetical protein n=1 Tax=Haliangium sp. TaxID=2663208 RepID=UPI003D10312C